MLCLSKLEQDNASHLGIDLLIMNCKSSFSRGLALLLCGLAFSLQAQDPAATDRKPSSTGDSRFGIPASDDGLPGAGPIRRYDWFRKVWTQRRSAWSRRADQDRNAVVFLGDSITQGWGDNLGGSFPGLKVANRGISGDTTRGVLIRLQEDVLSLHPAGVVLLIGTNDLEEKADPETVAANLKLILAALKQSNPAMPIVLCQVFPSSTSKKRPADQIKRLNQLYAAAVKGDAQIIFVETWLLFADAQGDARPEEFPDLLHPNKAGYTQWAAALRPSPIMFPRANSATLRQRLFEKLCTTSALPISSSLGCSLIRTPSAGPRG